jgi:uncharacterized protein (TIGR04255 family)
MHVTQASAQARPEHLPDFKSPPLAEVILGVQFSVPHGFQMIRAWEVWNLFREDYPVLQEHPPLPPSFETFGLPFQQAPMPQIRFFDGALHPRFWFLRPDGDQLIQFQSDRLMHNWRKVGDGANTYPRYESMVSEFENELTRLQTYMASLSDQTKTLSINQCEINYINHIEINKENGDRFSDWLNFFSLDEKNADDFLMGFRQVIRDEDGKPQGRFFGEATLGYFPDGKEKIVFSLAVKGAPQENTLASALSFLARGRDVIVHKFTELTTTKAHQYWERIK